MSAEAGVRGYLKTCADAGGRAQQLLLDHGVACPWPGWKLPAGVRRGAPRQCFRNAIHLASRQPGLYTYVEGVARLIITVEHAWCVAPDGTVVDPTWRANRALDGLAVPEYFGIPIRLEYALQTVVRTRTYSVLWNYVGRFPMLADNPSEWRV